MIQTKFKLTPGIATLGWYPSGSSTASPLQLARLFHDVEMPLVEVLAEMEWAGNSKEVMLEYLDRLQQPNGLFFHAEDVPFFWGRGDGWVAAGMTEMLRSLPVDHPERPRILAAYRKMMASLQEHGYPAHYYENVEGGHGAAADNEQAAVISALVLEFLWRRLSDSPG